MPREFTDAHSRQLLRLLDQYQEEFAPDLPQTIPALAEDLAMSLDETSNEDDKMRQDICQAWEGWPKPPNLEG